MKLSVASFFLTTSVAVLVASAPAQTTQQRVNKQRAPTAVRNGTVKICQGIPIPQGYIVVGYMTTAACPHGAYVIRKQDTDTERPVAANKKPDTDVQDPVAVNTKQDAQPRSTVAARKKPNSHGSVAMNRGIPQPPAASTAVSRPRRVGATEEETVAPTLQGVDPRPALGPPTLGGIGPAGTTVNASPADLSEARPEATGPEEVAEGDVIRIDTALVTVPVSVLDRQGRFVPNLRREDFTVFENGVEQSIVNFEPTEKPFTVALVLDTSASTHFHLAEIKEAAIAFAKQLRPQDRVLIVTFNDEVLLLTEATNDQNVVRAVIHEYASTGDSTRLYDAVDLVVKERLNKIKGRKAIVLFTDGVDTSSYGATYESTLRDVEELDALIYPIQYDTTDYLRAIQGAGTVTIVTNNSSWPFPGRSSSSRVIYNGPSTIGGVAPPGTTKADYERANQYLNELADRTGARLFKANDPAQLAQAFALIAEELRRQYSLGYYPQTVSAEGGERRQIKVKVRQPNLAVRARAGYMRSSSPSPTR